MVDRLRDGSPLSVSVTGGQLAHGMSQGGFDASMLSDDHYYSFCGPKTIASREEIRRSIWQRFHERSDALEHIDWNSRSREEILFYSMPTRAFSFPVPFSQVDDEPWDSRDESDARDTSSTRGAFALFILDGNVPFDFKPYLAPMVNDIRLFQN